MKGKYFVRFVIVFILWPLFFSCTDFFSTSLASWAARDPASLIPAVTTGNVDELIDDSENNPDMSLAVLKKIGDALERASPDDASTLQAAALEAAANASGFGPTLLNKASDISSLMEDKNNAKGLIIDTINDMPNLQETGEILTAVIPEPDTPEFDAFIEKADADDLATAAAVLLAAEAKSSSDSGDYINNFDSSASGLSPSANLAVKLAGEASKKYEETNSTSRLKDILEGLNLVST
jgi:hypothetical protein